MKGQLGAIFEGQEQIGGFAEWRIDAKFSPCAKSNISNEPPISTLILISWTATANKYWLFKNPGGRCRADFYQVVDGDKMALLASEEVDLTFNGPVDGLIHNSLLMTKEIVNDSRIA